jgi:mRNA interferase MazF
VKRGEIWWASLPKPAGRRPVILLSRDESYPVRALATVAPITTRIRRIPTEVPLGKSEGLPHPCVANLDTLTTLPQKCLEGYVGTLSLSKMQQIDEALRFALGLS